MDSVTPISDTDPTGSPSTIPATIPTTAILLSTLRIDRTRPIMSGIGYSSKSCRAKWAVLTSIRRCRRSTIDSPAHVHKPYETDAGSDIKKACANNCILARRLLEEGVRVVQLFNGSDPAGGNGISNRDSHSLYTAVRKCGAWWANRAALWFEEILAYTFFFGAKAGRSTPRVCTVFTVWENLSLRTKTPKRRVRCRTRVNRLAATRITFPASSSSHSTAKTLTW